MKKLGLLVMPLMAVSFLSSCGCSNPKPTPVVDVTHTFHFIGTNCTINGESDYSHDIFEKDKNVKYTIVPNAGYNLPETVEGIEYNPSNGVITINEIKNDIELRVEAIHIPQPGTTHTIHLDPSGGTITGKTILENLPDGEPVTTSPVISRDGYDSSQVKWYTKPNGEGEEFKFGPKGTGTDVVTDYFLHAKWGNVKQYTVHFEDFNGAEVISDQHPNYNDQVQRPSAPTKEGYNFINWYQEDKTTLYDFSKRLTSDDTEFTIYAKYEKINCHITYITNGGILGSTHIDSVEYGNSISTAPSISRDGYDASQVTWWLDSAMTSQQFTFGTTPINGNTNLYAKWGTIIKCQVHFVETSTITVDKDVDYGQRAAYYKPTRTGFNFVDWYDSDPEDPETGAQAEPFKFENSIIKETSIYAKWEVISGETCNVKFNITDCTVTYKESAIGIGGVNIEVPQGVDPFYVKFSIKANDNTYMKPSKVTLDKTANYSFNKENGELFINLQSDTVVTGACDMYKTLEECSWAQIEEISELGKAYEAFRVGDTKTVKINGLDHKVRIIDFNHDELSTSTEQSPKYAGITFEFANVITDSNGDAITKKWNNEEGSSSTNYDYRVSTLNTYLNSEVLDMLPSSDDPNSPDLKEVIKPVNKLVGINESETEGESNYESLPFETNKCPKLFPLAHDEITNVHNEDHVVSGEGTTYEYYKYSDKDERRIKKVVNDDAERYWLRSPCTDANNHAWFVSFGGNVDYYSVYYLAFGIAPAFCI